MDRTYSEKYKIAFVSQPEYFRFMYEHDLDDLAQIREFKLTYSMLPKDFTKLLEFDADFNVFFRGEFVPNEILKKLNGVTINLSSEPFPRKINHHIVYTKDSLNRYLSFRKIRHKSFDYVFHYDSSALKFMQKDGLYLSGEFVFPVATDVYQPVNLHNKWDIFFIGRSTSHRELFFSPLKHHFNFLHLAHGIWGEELVNYICASRINLNVHAENEISWEPRLQMLLACGAFVISEPITPNDVLRPGIDYVEVTSKNEMFEAISYYLNHNEERQKIAKSGQQRVHQQLDSKKVFGTFFDNIKNNYYPKFRVESGAAFWKFYSTLWHIWHLRNKKKAQHKREE